MSEVLELSDADFAMQMRGLIHEAERAITDRATSIPRPAGSEVAPAHEVAPAPTAEATPTPVAKAPGSQTVPEMLRPVVQGVQAIGRATSEHTQILGRLEKASVEAEEAQKELPHIVAELKGVLEQRNQLSRQMFDALHEELKTYKDGFLLDTVHRPMIRDLITLYDDLAHIRQQMHEALTVFQPTAAAAEQGIESGKGVQRLQNIEVHMEHNLHFILEVLARLEVQQLPVGAGKLDKHTQRAIAVEPAASPDEDMTVARTLKRGFLWKERVVRPEEVVVKKWKDGFLVALPNPTA